MPEKAVVEFHNGRFQEIKGGHIMKCPYGFVHDYNEEDSISVIRRGGK